MKTTIKKQISDEQLSTMQFVTLNTSIFPILNVGMYNTALDPNLEDFSDCIDGDFDYLGEFDYLGYTENVRAHAAALLEGVISERLEMFGVVAIRTPYEIDSPREYNCVTDTLSFDVYIADDFVETMKKNLNEFRKNRSLQKYIEDNYWSRDGFWSWMPKTFDEILDMDDLERCVAAYLTLCCLSIGLIDTNNESRYQDWLVEDCRSEMFNYQEVKRVEFEDERLEFMYHHRENELNELYWNLYFKIGQQWKSEDGRTDKDGKKRDFKVVNEMMRFIIWADNNGYTLDDLKKLVA